MTRLWAVGLLVVGGLGAMAAGCGSNAPEVEHTVFPPLEAGCVVVVDAGGDAALDGGSDARANGADGGADGGASAPDAGGDGPFALEAGADGAPADASSLDGAPADAPADAGAIDAAPAVMGTLAAPSTIGPNGPLITKVDLFTTLTTEGDIVPVGAAGPLAVDGSNNIVSLMNPGAGSMVVKWDSALHLIFAEDVPTDADGGSLDFASNGFQTGATYHDLAAGVDGSIYLSAFETIGPGQAEADLMKLGSDGKLAWLSRIDGNGMPINNMQGQGVAVAPDGTIVFVGQESATLLPGVNPSQGDASAVVAMGGIGGFAARFGADGTIRQLFQGFTGPVMGVAIGSDADPVVEINNGIVSKLTGVFGPVWSAGGSVPDVEVLPLSTAAPGGAVYDWGLDPLAGAVIERRDPSTGAVVWQRTLGSRRGPLPGGGAGGVEWAGSFGNVGLLAASDDALYVVGTFSNLYSGAGAPLSTSPLFVMKVSARGDEVWLTLVEEVLNGGTDFTAAGLALDQDRVVVSGGQTVFELSADDGSLL